MNFKIRNKIIFICFSFLFFLLTTISIALENKSNVLISREQAVLIAEATDEAKALYNLDNGRYRNCIEAKVNRPCEVDWVTCIEEAWAIEYYVGEVCKTNHDGRLSVMILVDGVSGDILSRFPEVKYYNEDRYCLESYDCLGVISDDGQPAQCLNFIYGQLEDFSIDEEACQCLDNVCTLKK